jgi:D-sedoheptulose 7-phosphate isomerase
MFINEYLEEVREIARNLDQFEIEKAVNIIYETRANEGRVFCLGVGGSASTASHSVNDFRKIVGIEAYAPTDNVSELSARTNDSGFETIFSEWLKISKLTSKDILCLFSVGGGDEKKKLSENLILAMKYAKEIGAKTIAIVGKSGGYAGTHADAKIIIPIINIDRITPHA